MNTKRRHYLERNYHFRRRSTLNRIGTILSPNTSSSIVGKGLYSVSAKLEEPNWSLLGTYRTSPDPIDVMVDRFGLPLSQYSQLKAQASKFDTHGLKSLSRPALLIIVSCLCKNLCELPTCRKLHITLCNADMKVNEKFCCSMLSTV